MRRTASAIIIAVALGILGCATTSILTPLPGTMNIVPPNPNLGKIAKCSGIWTGTWDNKFSQATTVVVEKIDSAKIVAVYSWGPYNGSSGDWVRLPGRIENESTLILEWGEKDRRKTVILILVGENLHAEYRRAEQINRAILTRVPAPAP